MERTLDLYGVPTDFGTHRRGVDMGPSAIRYAGLTQAIDPYVNAIHDRGNLDVVVPREPDPVSGNSTGPRQLPQIEMVTDTIASHVGTSLDENRFPLVIGGDHSIAMGTLREGCARRDIGVIWLDAHGDFNTPETTPSGNVHGMALAGALGLPGWEWAQANGLDPAAVSIVGVRDLDPGERALLAESEVNVFTMADIDQQGLPTVIETALDEVLTRVDAVHLSLDLDWLDPDEAPGVGTPVRGGVTYREAHRAMELIATYDQKKNILHSMDVVEVNPILDTHNRTAELAVELLASCFGDDIY